MENQSFKHSFPRNMRNALLVRDLSPNVINRNNKDQDFSKSLPLLYLPGCTTGQSTSQLLAGKLRLDHSLNVSHSAKKDLVMETVELN